MAIRLAQIRNLFRKKSARFKLLLVFIVSICSLIQTLLYFRTSNSKTRITNIGIPSKSIVFKENHSLETVSELNARVMDVKFPPRHNVFVLSATFRFPEVNVTRVMSFSTHVIGRNELLYFLLPDNSSPPQNSFNLSPLTAYQRRMSSKERQALLMVFQTFIRMCVRHNITFFLYGGSLLGAYRHHDVIPWDDDVDVMVNSSQKEILRHAMSSVDRRSFSIHFSNSSKFFWRRPRTLQHRPYRWPYVDIFFFRENQTHIYDEHPSYRDDFVFLKSQVFPLTHRPFAGTFLPVPKCSKSVLDQNYSPPVCKSSSFSHKLETGLHSSLHASMPCVALYSLYPFVFRSYFPSSADSRLYNLKEKTSGNGIITITREQLKKGNRSLHMFSFVDSPECS